MRFCEELRAEGVKIGTAELLDAFHALAQVSWTDREDFREALAATLKSQEDRRVFDEDRFFFRSVEAQAVERGLKETRFEGGERIDLDELRRQIEAAIRQGNDGEMSDLARLAVAAFGGQGESLGVIESTYSGSGGPWTCARRAVRAPKPARGSTATPCGASSSSAAGAGARPDPPHREPAALRRWPSSTVRCRAGRSRTRQVHRVVAQLKRRLANATRPVAGAQVVDVRRTMRASSRPGVPLRLRYRPKRPRRPEIYVLCDVSTSVTSASVFFLSVPHALHDAFRKLRSFAFVERIDEVTDIFERSAPSERSRTRGRRAWRTSPATRTTAASGRSSWTGSVTTSIRASTVIVLGDARTNGREPHAGIFGHVAELPGACSGSTPSRVCTGLRLRDAGLRALLRRRVRVLDDEAARTVRERGRGPARDQHLGR